VKKSRADTHADTRANSADQPQHEQWLHFAGVGGSGMSALAQYHALAGGRTTGSDRAFDEGQRAAIRAGLEKSGVIIHPQDGSGLEAGCAGLVVSTAVEDSVPDVRIARDLGIPILHRSELLARHVAQKRTVAVTGTSGKSTVTAMVFSLLHACELEPSLLTGAALPSLVAQGYLGNAWSGTGDLLVIEADESDGSLVRYHPWAGLVLNLSRDHKEPAELLELFLTFRRQTGGPFLVGESPALAPVKQAGPCAVFGVEPGADFRAEYIDLQPNSSRFVVDGVPFSLPIPGHYNVLNALAAIAIGTHAGLSLEAMAPALAGFQGVARRFQSVGTAGDVEVIDDFAHNPDKIAAALATARGRGRRILAVFQPHGFGPTRFLKDDLIAAFAAHLTKTDVLWLPEIFYAGGTVTRDISSRDLTDALCAAGYDARFCAGRDEIPPAIAAEAQAGDVVLVMGARDPSLTDFCGEILAGLADS